MLCESPRLPEAGQGHPWEAETPRSMAAATAALPDCPPAQGGFSRHPGKGNREGKWKGSGFPPKLLLQTDTGQRSRESRLPHVPHQCAPAGSCRALGALLQVKAQGGKKAEGKKGSKVSLKQAPSPHQGRFLPEAPPGCPPSPGWGRQPPPRCEAA